MSKRILLDANVLIDYQGELCWILEGLVQCAYTFCIVDVVLAEAKTWKRDDFRFEVFSPTVEERLEIQSAGRYRGLSENDRFVLQAARARQMPCATNDRALYRTLVENGIKVYSSRRLCELAREEGVLNDETALSVLAKLPNRDF